MRVILLFTTLLAGPAAAAETAQAVGTAPQPASNQECLQCHEASKPEEAGVRIQAYAASVHKDLECTACHAGYTAPGPHELPAPTDPAEARLLSRLQAGQTPDGKPRTTAPRAYLACSGCHADAGDYPGTAHGRWLSSERPVAGPVCASCHGSPHEVPEPAKKSDAVKYRARAETLSKRCERCHDDTRLLEAAGLEREVAVNYHDSIHGRLVAIGSSRAPLCTSCHAWMVGTAGHKSIAGPKELASTVALASPASDKDNRVQTCAQCHKASNATFASLIAHKPLQETGKVPHLVHVAFSYLTTLTLLFFAFHVLVDFTYELRKRLARRKEAHHDPEDLKTVVRLDIHQRIQHWLMLSGVILLGITGWPLRGAGAGTVDMAQRIESSRKFLALFGGPHGAGVVHRVAAVMIILSSVYHLAYLTLLAKKRVLPFSMLPVPKDAIDMRDNILFMLGVSKKKPRFERYNYLEKFDYWAVFWGIVMMVGTGFIFWFPAELSRVLPAWFLTSAQIVHGEEATLAILFLFVVHFYNVHLKPSLFPMNWAWLNGRTTIEYMKDEHPAEYERVFKKGAGGK